MNDGDFAVEGTGNCSADFNRLISPTAVRVDVENDRPSVMLDSFKRKQFLRWLMATWKERLTLGLDWILSCRSKLIPPQLKLIQRTPVEATSEQKGESHECATQAPNDGRHA